jgi:hypothetical protein
MDLGVDHAGQEVQPATIDGLAGSGACEIADHGDTATGNTEVTHAFAIMIDDGAALENQIVALSHSTKPPL